LEKEVLSNCSFNIYKAWGELASLIDYSNPLESMAKTYLNPILNHGPKYKLNKMKK